MEGVFWQGEALADCCPSLGPVVPSRAPTDIIARVSVYLFTGFVPVTIKPLMLSCGNLAD